MSESAKVVDAYLCALGAGAFDSARKLLCEDLTFRGPFDTFSEPDSYMKARARLQPIVKSVKIRRLFEDGSEVCLLYDMETNTPAGTALICEWFTIRAAKISAITAIFDARPFAPLFSK